MNRPKHHELKLFIGNFQSVKDGLKRSDIRRNDRDFRPMDTITYHEGYMNHGEYVATGRTAKACITHIDNFGLLDPDHDVNLSIEIIK